MGLILEARSPPSLFFTRSVSFSHRPKLFCSRANASIDDGKTCPVKRGQTQAHVQVMIYIHRVKHRGALQTLCGVGVLLKTTNCVMVSDEHRIAVFRHPIKSKHVFPYLKNINFHRYLLKVLSIDHLWIT